MTDPIDGIAEMTRLVDTFPSHLVEGMSRARKVGFHPEGSMAVVTVGMGGSAIAGDLLASLAAQVGARPIVPVRSTRLPSWAGKGSVAIFVSYSGNTEETVRAFEETSVRGLERVVVTSGGKLLELAETHGYPSVRIPSGLPPRAALGYLFGALYGILLPIFPDGARQMARTIVRLKALRPRLKVPGGPASRAATAWGAGELWVYVPERLAPVGRRWVTQASENAKRLAHFDTLPEAMHNAIVGWDRIPPADAAAKRVILLSGASEDVLVEDRLSYLSEMMRQRGNEPLPLRLTAKDPLTELLEGTWTGDYASLFEAAATGVDPVPVEAIDRMKSGLPPSRRALRSPSATTRAARTRRSGGASGRRN